MTATTLSGVQLRLRLEDQRNAVADEVSALTAVVRPILLGTLLALKVDVAHELGGFEQLKLKMLARAVRQGDGDCGICFEYAVHDALARNDPLILERIDEVLTRFCRIRGQGIGSILFGAEKSGVQHLIDTANEVLTPESLLMYGTRGRPVRLKKHINAIAQAFRRGSIRSALPQSISGLWRADLFLGKSDADRWVGTTVKLNPRALQGYPGLRVGIIPSLEGEYDPPWRDERRNLIVCPLPHDGHFMEVFYNGWQIVQQFFAADARVPREVALPRPPMRQVARYLEDRREWTVMDVVDVLSALSQPNLLETSARDTQLIVTRQGPSNITSVIAPTPRTI